MEKKLKKTLLLLLCFICISYFYAEQDYIHDSELNRANFVFKPLQETDFLEIIDNKLYRINNNGKKEKLDDSFIVNNVLLSNADNTFLIVSKSIKENEYLYFIDGKKGSCRYLFSTNRDSVCITDKSFRYLIISDSIEKFYYQFFIYDLMNFNYVRFIKLPDVYESLVFSTSESESFDFSFTGDYSDFYSYNIKDDKLVKEKDIVLSDKIKNIKAAKKIQKNFIIDSKFKEADFSFIPLKENETIKLFKTFLYRIDSKGKKNILNESFTASMTLFKSSDNKKAILSKFINDNEILYFVDGITGVCKYICNKTSSSSAGIQITITSDFKYLVCAREKNSQYYDFDIFDLTYFNVIKSVTLPEQLEYIILYQNKDNSEEIQFEGNKELWKYNLKENRFTKIKDIEEFDVFVKNEI